MAKKRDIEGNRLHHFELSDKNRTVRWVLIAILLVVALVAVMIGLMSALQMPAGWQTVEASSTKRNCADSFVLQYELGAQEQSASAESKALELLYGRTAENAWQLFHNEAGASEQNGIYAVNASANKEITVESQLYAAFVQLQENGTRVLYLGPVYDAYDRVFHSADEIIAEDNDPTADPYTREYVAKLADFANDPESVELELRGDNKVFLRVSEEYLAFAKENAVERFLDFGWLRNAFIIDYMAQKLTENGFTNGYFTSVDGFVRNLDQRATGYSFNLFDKGKAVAVMEYPGAASIAFLRSYPVYEEDYGRFYTFSDGRVVTSLIDPGDGQCKAALDQMVTYSREKGCAELALAMLPVYVTEDLDEQLLSELTQQGIYSLWFAGAQLRYNLQDLQLQLYDKSYTPQLVN